MSYSQNNEEAIILAELNRRAVTNGTLLEIGAYNPTALSNSRALVELGWSAVMVEPSPKPFLSLLDVYGSNPRIQLVHAAITSGAPGLVEWFDSNGDAVSTTSAAHREKWEAGTSLKFSRFHVPVIPLDFLFQKFGFNFEFISIDVESTNRELFRALPWPSLQATKVICVEHDNHVSELTQMAAANGFAPVHMNGENLIFARSE